MLKMHQSLYWMQKNNLKILKWTVVNDTVMGGRSKSSWEHIDDKNAKFSGTLSLENNGGFCSVRTYPIDLKLNRTQGILLKVLGDGRSYSLNARSRKTRSGINYRATFATTKDKVSKVWLGLRTLNQPGGETGLKIYRLLRVRILRNWIFFGDKRPGDFSLELVKIEAMYKISIMNDNT
jgi:NADH dehydrogenase [ubiquinone] 1 alpha subcomplex assembly factor 1